MDRAGKLAVAPTPDREVPAKLEATRLAAASQVESDGFAVVEASVNGDDGFVDLLVR